MILSIVFEMAKLAFGLAMDVGAAATIALFVKLVFECKTYLEKNYPGLEAHSSRSNVEMIIITVFLVAVVNVPVVNWFLAYIIYDRFEDVKREAIDKIEDELAAEIELWKLKNEHQT